MMARANDFSYDYNDEQNLHALPRPTAIPVDSPGARASEEDWFVGPRPAYVHRVRRTGRWHHGLSSMRDIF